MFLHPQGLAPRIVNLDEWAWHIIDRIQAESMRNPDDQIQRLARKILPAHSSSSTNGRCRKRPACSSMQVDEQTITIRLPSFAGLSSYTADESGNTPSSGASPSYRLPSSIIRPQPSHGSRIGPSSSSADASHSSSGSSSP